MAIFMVFFIFCFVFVFFLLALQFGRDSPAVAVRQCWGVALQDGAKSCRHELVFPGVPGRLNESRLSSAAFNSLYINRQEL